MPKLKVDGIITPATQVPSADPNTLDDYEEGTWTPVLGGDGGASGQTYSARLASYTKIGRVVTLNFEIVLSAAGTLTGTLAAITGLPFAAMAGGPSAGASIGYGTGFATAIADLGGYVAVGSSILYLSGTTASPPQTSPRGNLAKTVIGNTTSIIGAVTYVV